MPVDYERSRLLFRRLSRLVGRARKKPQVETVHQIRTTARRLEALLEAHAEHTGTAHTKLAKRLRRLRRRAGRVRDLDVQMAALRTVKIGRDAARKTQLMDYLAAERARRERKLVAALDDDSLRKLRRQLRRAQAEVAPMENPGPAGDSPVRPRHRSPLEPLPMALRAFARLVRETGPLTEANLHEFRTRGKRVRYLAEMAGDDPDAKRVVKELKRMQDAIGEWHDWLVLTRKAEELFADGGESPLLSALRNLTRARFMRALRSASDVKRTLLEMHKALGGRGGPGVPVSPEQPKPSRSEQPPTVLAEEASA
ncbi:MAG TPA: CHAD domain-containing protein [Terriglobales bacterium]|nr:CHAD domain-containing protein [Terriglobales bacterium]